jgi:CRISPR-associated protein Cmr2
MKFYQRKLYTLLRIITGTTKADSQNTESLCQYLSIFTSEDIQELSQWWQDKGNTAAAIASSSDRVNLNPINVNSNTIELRHPLSGQQKEIPYIQNLQVKSIAAKIQTVWQQISQEPEKTEDEKITKLYWWCWRFYPQFLTSFNIDLLTPAHTILPDCSHHSYNSTVSALIGAMYPKNWQAGDEEAHPYLLIFTFSPVQEFIKASRKFLDFWGGSYLLHYLSAIICWEVAKLYGPDAVITPSLWSQEIIDAFLLKLYPDFQLDFVEYEKTDPISKFWNQNNPPQSLCTAGFPNVITALVGSKQEAIQLGQHLKTTLKTHWQKIARKVREDVKTQFINSLADEYSLHLVLQEIQENLLGSNPTEEAKEELEKELTKLRQPGCWEWNGLWDAQINHTWETYFVAVSLGTPNQALQITIKQNPQGQETTILDSISDQIPDIEYITKWIEYQNQTADIRFVQKNNSADNQDNQADIEPEFIGIPTTAELQAYHILNVGTWWGSFQGRLGKAIQAIKNTRAWQIPVASGERSTLSGQYTALHPRFLYQNFHNGLGLPLESLRLFWQVMAVVYRGVFNGSEKLNAIELTKRLAWRHGGVAESLGIDFKTLETEKLDNDHSLASNLKIDGQNNVKTNAQNESGNNNKKSSQQSKSINYEGLIRFPNLCSIAAANFATHHPKIMQRFWSDLQKEISQHPQLESKHDEFCSRTRRPFQVRRADAALKTLPDYGNGLNGVMFSSKWLADDMNLDPTETSALRTVIDKVQRQYFGDGSPADWWVLVLGDGDGMGNYVNGSSLRIYSDYIVANLVDDEHKNNENWQDLLKTKKRMGPATHVGLNRALLDFSNRLVPYITEQRYCGKVIYSGGDDVMAALPLADLPGFLMSLRAAWCGANDPENQFKNEGGYWLWEEKEQEKETRPLEIPGRPLFTMGKGATMSLGIVIAHKSVPLPTVLESIWDAEAERAKKLLGAKVQHNDSLVNKDKKPRENKTIYANKDGLCFQVIYGSGNTLEALMKGHLLPRWWKIVHQYQSVDLSPVLYRLAEELPRHAEVTKDSRLFRKAAQVILASRDKELSPEVQFALLKWLDGWEKWAWRARQTAEEFGEEALGTKPEDLANLLRFSAFLVSRRQQEVTWEK